MMQHYTSDVEFRRYHNSSIAIDHAFLLVNNPYIPIAILAIPVPKLLR